MRYFTSETVASPLSGSYSRENSRLLFGMDNQRIGFTLTMRLIALIASIG